MIKITKYEHACFTVEKDSQILVIDPGNFTTDFIAPDHVIGIVVTHNHADHFDHELIANIIDKNPNAIIIGDESITNTIEAFRTKTVAAGDSLTVGLFDLEFFGGNHASIREGVSLSPNLGILINDLLYYPGDSFFVPKDRGVDTLALPVAAPWLKISDTLEFLSAIRPRAAFPTHDAILSPLGKDLVDRLVGAAANTAGIIYTREASLTI
jgi:L-ascorbate metabolism protein UlaG (beta-lactamase superfamily)